MKLEMKYFGPKGMKEDEVRMKVLNALRSQGTVIKSDFHSVTRTWNHQPRFETEIHFSGTEPSLNVTTNDKVFGFLDAGTRSHWVKPKRAGVLAFRSKYRSKTRPRIIGSTAGGGSGAMAFSKGHRVSGIQKREFTKTIKSIRKPGFERAMQTALREGLDNIWEK